MFNVVAIMTQVPCKMPTWKKVRVKAAFTY